MRHFLRIGEINPTPILHALQMKPDLWNLYDLRSTYPGSPHREVDDILCRFNELGDPSRMVDDLNCVAFPAWFDLPIQNDVLNLMRLVGGVRLGRVMITRLAPGKRIYPHTDEGAPATYYRRYQICLQNLPGSTFRIEEEQVTFRGGEVWHIDNRREHEVFNGSADDRIVLIADIRVSVDE